MTPSFLNRSAAAQRLVNSHFDSVVTAGPFVGLRLPATSFCSPRISKLAGIYEREIAPWIEGFLQKNPATVVDVGAAEGYYAVGFARRLSGSQIVAFEKEAVARELLEECIRLNGPLPNIEMHGICEPEALESSLHGRNGALVLMDIEGGEAELLDPAVVPSLLSASIVVELHEYAVPGLRKLIETRFAATHDILVRASEPRAVADYPVPLSWWQKTWYRKHIVNALWDRYVAQEWLCLTPKTAHG